MIEPDRRQQILDAALACFLERGYLATTMADIRAASGATTGSIYHFFAGKGGLAEALLRAAITGWAEAGDTSEPGDAPEAAIKASVRGLILWGLANPAHLRFMDEMRVLARTDADLARVMRFIDEGQTLAAAHFTQLANQGVVRTLPWPIAYSLILGPAYNYLRLAGPTAPEQAQRLAEFFANAAWDAVRAP